MSVAVGQETRATSPAATPTPTAVAENQRGTGNGSPYARADSIHNAVTSRLSATDSSNVAPWVRQPGSSGTVAM